MRIKKKFILNGESDNYVFDKCSQVKHDILESIIKKAKNPMRHCVMKFLYLRIVTKLILNMIKEDIYKNVENNILKTLFSKPCHTISFVSCTLWVRFMIFL